jgi:nicotinamide mononucleotide transporter
MTASGTIMEWIALLLGVLYVLFAALEKASAWIFGGLSACLYVLICFNSQLYIEASLQFFYVVLALVGWLNWFSKKSGVQQIHRMQLKKQLKFLPVIFVLGLILGYLVSENTQQFNPYLDAQIGVFCLYATYLTTQKILENWLFWIVIDLVLIYLYVARGLYPTAFLYGIYSIVALVGYFNWKKKLQV